MLGVWPRFGLDSVDLFLLWWFWLSVVRWNRSRPPCPILRRARHQQHGSFHVAPSRDESCWLWLSIRKTRIIFFWPTEGWTSKPTCTYRVRFIKYQEFVFVSLIIFSRNFGNYVVSWVIFVAIFLMNVLESVPSRSIVGNFWDLMCNNSRHCWLLIIFWGI